MQASSNRFKQARAFEHWVREVMVQLFVDPGSSVCEMLCGKGQDCGKLDRRRIGMYVGIDNARHIKDAQKRWRVKQQPFPARFIVLDALKQSVRDHMDPVDSVMCQGRLQRAFGDRGRARRLLTNVASVLKPGGFFFGFTIDPSVLWSLGQKWLGRQPRNNPHLIIRNDSFTIDMGTIVHFADHKRASKGKDRDATTPGATMDLKAYGTKYNLIFNDGSLQHHFLIHPSSLIQMAASVGLDFVSMTNFTEFLVEHRGLEPFSKSLAKTGILDAQGNIPSNVLEIISLYTTFVFRKKSSRMSSSRSNSAAAAASAFPPDHPSSPPSYAMG